MKKQLILIASVVAVTGTAVAVGSTKLVSAQSTPSSSSTTTVSPTSTSNLKSRRVHRIRAYAKLDQAVRDGIITANQKTSLMTEMKKLHTEK